MFVIDQKTYHKDKMNKDNRPKGGGTLLVYSHTNTQLRRYFTRTHTHTQDPPTRSKMSTSTYAEKGCRGVDFHDWPLATATTTSRVCGPNDNQTMRADKRKQQHRPLSDCTSMETTRVCPMGIEGGGLVLGVQSAVRQRSDGWNDWNDELKINTNFG